MAVQSIAMFLSLLSAALAVRKEGPPFLVNTNIIGAQVEPSVAGLGSPITAFVSVWEGQWTDSTEGSIYGQIFSLDKQKIGSELTINDFTTGRQSQPDVGGLANGDFVVVWASKDEDGSGMGIYAKMYDSVGANKTSAFLVNTAHTTSDQQHPKVIGVGTGFLITWTSNQQDASQNGVYASLFDSSANEVNTFRVNTQQTNDQYKPDATILEDGRIVIAWTSEADGNGDGIYAQVYSSTGTPDGYEIKINTYTTNNQQYPSVSGLKGGGFVVAWMSNLQDTSGKGVYAQVLTSSSGLAGKEINLNNGYKDQDQFDVQVAGLKEGGFIATWSSFEQDGSGNGVHGQLYNALYEQDGAQFEVPTSTTGDQEHSCLLPLPNGGFLALWSSKAKSLDTSLAGIHGQEFLLYDATMQPTSSAPQTAPSTSAPRTLAPMTGAPGTLVPGATASPTGVPSTFTPSTQIPGQTSMPTGVPVVTIAPGNGTQEPTPSPPSDDGPNVVIIIVIVVAVVAVIGFSAAAFFFMKSSAEAKKFGDFGDNTDLLNEMQPEKADGVQVEDPEKIHNL
eukprot:TRINITY_DN14260_c4_g1_i1.p1 TRINITY_DN14260_c4_g1~~TRINITY_DN14260_c4_g1_i1.p1  ORF type:complete len:562 (+),score=90.50 TRINITY_DN14260_c4_g1_i1:31-1716(+)